DGEDFAILGTARDGVQLVAFRGTVNLAGWASNFAADLVAWAGLPGKVHRGFAQALDEFILWLRVHLKNDRSVQLTGHSRGGALATLAAQRLRDAGYDLLPVYTFGAPRVGDAAFALSYSPILHRVVHDDDPVPHVPSPLAGYRHVGEEAWIDQGGAVSGTPS